MRRRSVLVFEDWRGGAPVALTRHFCTPLVVRWLFLLKSAGFEEVVVLAPARAVREVEALVGDGAELGLRISYELPGSQAAPSRDGESLFVRADYLVDPEAFGSFLGGEYTTALHRGVVILRKLGSQTAGREVELDALVEPRRRPACVHGGDEASARAALQRWSRKGIHVTSRLNAPLEDAIIRAVGGICWLTPNRVTLLVNALAPLAMWLFLSGDFLRASAFSYALGVLDGVDGKLARVRGVLTKLGHLEHSLDALYEQALYASFTLGLVLQGYGLLAASLGLAFLVVDSFVRHVYNQFALVTGKPLKRYSRFDEKFALVDGRRNIYLLYFLASSAAGLPLLGLVLALAHAVVTALVYLLRAAHHLRELDRREGVEAFKKLLGGCARRPLTR
uniref:CDP-alcohol phosphatidyltransferase family protein n=1 Tax=Thermofilum pendens TaxID=2269 RepID=A0A7J3X5C0_THEPE